MQPTPAPTAPAKPPRWYHLSLGKQIVVGLVIGLLIGVISPAFAKYGETLRSIFLHLIQVMIAPLVFASIVQGIAGTEDLKKVGRIGAKALIYFEVITVFALALGLLGANLLQPGVGVKVSGDISAISKISEAKPMTFAETLVHMFPTSVMESMAKNDVLQIVVFAVLFAIAASHAGEPGKKMVEWCDSLRQVMFSYAAVIMKVAPIGVAAAIAVSVGDQGIGVLVSLGKLVISLYITLAVFVVVVLGAVIWLMKIPFRPFLRAVSAPVTLAFATANSEAALPDAFARMERFGVPRGIVGFVLPMGYSFNLDGSTLYLALASVFIGQAAETTTGVHFGLDKQIPMMLVLMLTSKGVAAVPRASIVVLVAAVQSFNLPLAGAAMILGVDAFMDMARTSVNVLGNCLASVVVAKWEGEFDAEKANREFGPGSGDRDTSGL